MIKNGHYWFTISNKGDDINSYKTRSTIRYLSSAIDAYSDVIGGTLVTGTMQTYPFIVSKMIK